MDIFQALAYFVTYYLLALNQNSYLAFSLNFFIEDTLKIFALLIVVSFIMAVFRFYFPMEKTRDILSKSKLWGLDYFLAAALGVVTPFCSCSSIPLFYGFLAAGIPIGIIFTFLISSPLVNEASLFFFPVILGWKITLIYNLLGMAIAIIGGIIFQKIKAEKYLDDSVQKIRRQDFVVEAKAKLSLSQKLQMWFSQSIKMFQEVYVYILLGVGLGALVHGFIPQDFFLKYLSSNNFWAVPLATIIGVPIYASGLSVIPLIQVSIEKGMGLGTALSFMTSVVTLSLPQALMLKKMMQWKLFLWFYLFTTIAIIFMGYFFNFFQSFLL
ncbi:permease [Candidatus Beckwithbacteria bacterium]|nr:permease [Candidatus Beckwithbacteria bacterium]